MITKLDWVSDGQLEQITRLIGEAFVPNELFHNWCPVPELDYPNKFRISFSRAESNPVP